MAELPSINSIDSMATSTATYDELQSRVEKLHEQSESVKASESEAALAGINAKIAKYGSTAAQLRVKRTR